MKSVFCASGYTYLESMLNASAPRLNSRLTPAKGDPRVAMGLLISDDFPKQGGGAASAKKQREEDGENDAPIKKSTLNPVRVARNREVVNRIMRMKELVSYIGMSKSAIYLLIKGGDFPASISLGERAVGYLKNEIDDWIDSRSRTGSPTFGGAK